MRVLKEVARLILALTAVIIANGISDQDQNLLVYSFFQVMRFCDVRVRPPASRLTAQPPLELTDILSHAELILQR